MRPLIVMPAVKNPHVTRQALESIIYQPVGIVLCANGADQDIRDLFQEYKEKREKLFNDYEITIWDEPVNIGVNPVWNKFLDYFIKSQYTHIGILSSDVILHKSFLHIVKTIQLFLIDKVPLFKEVNKEEIFEDIYAPYDWDYTEIDNGYPGFFIWLSKEQAEKVYPIPNEIKLWYGDEWIYTILRNTGTPTILCNNLLAFHEGSQTLKEMSNTNELIESDKNIWRQSVQQQMFDKIEQLRNG